MSEHKSITVTQRVRYAETDAMGIVHHANYFLWFEVGRVEALRQLGYPYTRLEHEGLGLPLKEVGCRYTRAAKFDDLLHIEVWIEALQSRAFRLGYRIAHAETNEEVATGFTAHICWRNGAVVTLPSELREKLQMMMKS